MTDTRRGASPDRPSSPRPTSPQRHPLSRRAVLGGEASAGSLGAGGTVTVPSALAQGPAAGSGTAFDAARRTWVDLLTGGEVDLENPHVVEAIAQQDAAATATLKDLSATETLWPDLNFAEEPAHLTRALERIRAVALCVSTPGSTFHQDQAVAQRLVRALRGISTTGYVAGRPAPGNWYEWEIGVPTQLTDVLVLLDDAVPEDVRTPLLTAADHYAPDPNWRGRGTTFAETGANRVDKSLRSALRGILRGDEKQITDARDALSDTVRNGRASMFTTVTSGDGFYADGSFIQHDYIAYTGQYGVVALRGIAQALALLGGTPWKVTDPGTWTHTRVWRAPSPRTSGTAR